MDFSYRHLASVYDRLFPLDPQALTLVLQILEAADEGCSVGTQLPGSPRTAVDAGCGTGLLVRALADRGYRAHGFDLDGDLLAQARLRQGRGASFDLGDVRTFRLPAGWEEVSVLTCLGNTLAHLTAESDLEAFLVRAREALSSTGGLLLQVLDYDYLERTGTYSLPELMAGDLRFTRRYQVCPSGLWTFHTALSGPGVEESASFDLRPWRRTELESALVRTGYRIDGVWGGYDLRAPGNSLPLVLRASLL